MKSKLGKPKYKIGDIVSFELVYKEQKTKLTGEVYIVDAYGTFEQNEEPSYDIMVNNWNGNERCLVKHIKEADLIV